MKNKFSIGIMCVGCVIMGMGIGALMVNKAKGGRR